jgi:hypothetical protein
MSHRTGAVHRHESSAPQLKQFLSDFVWREPTSRWFAEMDLLDFARGGFGIDFDKTGAGSIRPALQTATDVRARVIRPAKRKR